MFTGLVEELGTVRSIDADGDAITITIDAPLMTADASLGDSIAVNGCCLTVVHLDGTAWQANAVPETMDRTNLGLLGVGSAVNLERPMAADGRFGGHVVQGHVDTTTTVTGIDAVDGGSFRSRFALPASVARYVVAKGSVTLDGISLTVAALGADWFEVAVIPHTAEVTTLGRREVGDVINVEVDVLAKYVERQLEFLSPTATPSLNQES